MAWVLRGGNFRVEVSYNEPGCETHLNRIYWLAIYDHKEITYTRHCALNTGALLVSTYSAGVLR